jgi:hypothetical protein
MLRDNGDKAVLASILLVLAHCSGRPSRSHRQSSDEWDSENLIQSSGDRMLVVASNLTGIKVSQWHDKMPVNPEELGEYLEGDIMVSDSLRRNGLRSENSRWPDGVVPYMLSPYFSKIHLRSSSFLMCFHLA